MRKKEKGLSFIEKKKKVNAHMLREIFGMVFGTFAAMFLAVVLTFSMGMRTNTVGVSMEPTLFSGDEILINRFIYKLSRPKKNDVIAAIPMPIIM